MRDDLVGHRVLAKGAANHRGLDLDWNELAPIVDRDGHPDHLREDDHVTEVCLHNLRLLAGLRNAAEAQLVHKAEVLHGKAVLSYASPASRIELGENVGDLHRDKLLNLDPPEVGLRETPATCLNLICHPTLHKRGIENQIKLLYCAGARAPRAQGQQRLVLHLDKPLL